MPGKCVRLNWKLLCQSAVCCSFLFFHSSYAASFNCSKAKTQIETTICSDPRLSALDDRLNLAYKSALKKAGEGDVVVRHDQRSWLSDLQDQCTGQQISACVEQQQTARIAKLAATPAFDASRITEYKVTRASRYFDFVIRLFTKPADPKETTREGPGRVLIFKKGAAAPEQSIVMDNILVSLDDKGLPLVNSSNLYSYQGLVNVGDFNFDGHEDLAIQNGNNGAYQGPSYDVYLYSPAANRFDFSKPLSELILGSLGFFQVDPARKLLTTLSKEGCCYHETVSYAVLDNKLAPVSREIDDNVKNQERKEEMVNGKWKLISKHTLPSQQQ